MVLRAPQLLIKVPWAAPGTGLWWLVLWVSLQEGFSNKLSSFGGGQLAGIFNKCTTWSNWCDKPPTIFLSVIKLYFN